MTVEAELGPGGRRVLVTFPYSPTDVEAMRTISGRRWEPKTARWSIPADWQACTELRRAFGEELHLGPRVRKWGWRERRRHERLKELSQADTAVLESLPLVNRGLAEAIHIGPRGAELDQRGKQDRLMEPASFQAADVRFMVDSPNPLNANHMGLGKTIETIAAIYEAGLHEGPILVIAPISAVEGTWPEELVKWTSMPFWVARGTAEEKRAVHDEFEAWTSSYQLNKETIKGNPGWLIINPEQIQLREEVNLCPAHDGSKPLDLPMAFGAFPKKLNHKKVTDLKIIKQCSKCEYRLYEPYPALFSIKWNAIIVDEAHESGLMNPKTLTGRGAQKLKLIDNGKKIALSGTPMGGREEKLFGILQFLNPKVFTSKWRWAESLLEIDVDHYGKTIKGIKRCDDCRLRDQRNTESCDICYEYEQRFFKALDPYILRRTKEEVIPDLPAKQRVQIWCPFGSPRHEVQYQKFARDAEAVIDGKRITAVNVISEYTRLAQFSWGTWKHLPTGDLVPTADSGKLQALEDKLTELGIFDPEGTEQAVIFSQFKSIVDLVHAWLEKKGVAVGKLHGGTNRRGERAELKRRFQEEGNLRVLVVSTRAGGTSLTLDRANSVFMLDKTWKPDNQEQAEDRVHRASRIHQVTVYEFMTQGTIEEYKEMVNIEKAIANNNVMDLRRMFGLEPEPEDEEEGDWE